MAGVVETVHGLVPKGWKVIVLADRGLYAKWLFEAIVELKWHPFLRVNSQGTFRREGGITGSHFPTGACQGPTLAGTGNRF